jgi:hypothetical protein
LVSRSVFETAAAVVAAASVAFGAVVPEFDVAGVVAAAGCVAAGAAAVVAELELLSEPHAAATTDMSASAASVRPAAVPKLRLFTSISPLCRGLMVRPFPTDAP